MKSAGQDEIQSVGLDEIKSTIPPAGGFHREIFGDAECEIIHFVNYEIFCLRRK